MTTLLWLRELRRHGCNNKHVVKGQEQLSPVLKPDVLLTHPSTLMSSLAPFEDFVTLLKGLMLSFS